MTTPASIAAAVKALEEAKRALAINRRNWNGPDHQTNGFIDQALAALAGQEGETEVVFAEHHTVAEQLDQLRRENDELREQLQRETDGANKIIDGKIEAEKQRDEAVEQMRHDHDKLVGLEARHSAAVELLSECIANLLDDGDAVSDRERDLRRRGWDFLATLKAVEG